MENQELLLLELEEFERSNQIDKQIPQNLENLIEYVAKTGTYIFPWNKIKKLYINKIVQCIENFSHSSRIDDLAIPNFDNVVFNDMKNRLLERMKLFHNAPFTIQRISELLLKPQCNYSRIDKFLRGLEKCIMVVTTVDPQGNKIFTENMMNGIMNDSSLNGVYSQKSFSSLHIETTTTTTTATLDALNTDRIKLIKQARIDFSEVDTKLTDNTEVKTNSLLTVDVELKIENKKDDNIENNDEKKESEKLNQNEENDDKKSMLFEEDTCKESLINQDSDQSNKENEIKIELYEKNNENIKSSNVKNDDSEENKITYELSTNTDVNEAKDKDESITSSSSDEAMDNGF